MVFTEELENYEIESHDGSFRGTVRMPKTEISQAVRDRFNGNIKAETADALFDTLREAYGDGTHRAVAYYLNDDGQLQDRADGTAAFREWGYNGVLAAEGHYEGDKLQNRADGTAAFQEWDDAGLLRSKKSYEDGKLQDGFDGTPAVQKWHENSELAVEAHYEGDKLQDRADGTPAVQKWHENGELAVEAHYKDGRRHDRVDGTPAYQKWHENGELAERVHLIDGRLYDPADRLPARMSYYEQGKPYKAEFADNRIEMNSEELQKLQKGLDQLGESRAPENAFGDIAKISPAGPAVMWPGYSPHQPADL